MSFESVFWTTLLVVGLVGCAGAKANPRIGPATVSVGQCGQPDGDGVLSDSPQLKRADRDLDGDGIDEVVAADQNLCNSDGNCQWNLFGRGADGGCWRYLGTVAGAYIEADSRGGEDGFVALQTWWRFGDSGRYLLSSYSYSHGGYRVVEALLCREQEDDRVLCASEEESSPQ